MTEDDFDALLADPPDVAACVRQDLESSERMLRESPSDSLIPMLTVLARTMAGEDQNMLFALAVNFNKDHEKRQTLRAVGRNLFEMEVVPLVVTLASEAWVVRNLPEGVEPRHCANRQEAVIVFGRDLSGKNHAAGRIFVSRDAQNHMVPASPAEMLDARVEAKLLGWLFRGFFDVVAAKYGHPN